MTSISTLWEPFEVATRSFRANSARVDPAHLGQGRDPELQRVRRRLSTDTATRTIIEGAPGIGKTSFVNRLKSDLAKHGIATYDRPIRIDSKSTRSSFVADVLRTLLRIRLGMGPSNGAGVWARTVRLLEGQDLTGGSVSVMGVGGGFTRSYAAPQASRILLYEHRVRRWEELARAVGPGRAARNSPRGAGPWKGRKRRQRFSSICAIIACCRVLDVRGRDGDRTIHLPGSRAGQRHLRRRSS